MIFIVPLMSCLHTAHELHAGAHCAQQTKCPHGKNVMALSASQQITHNIFSLNSRFCSLSCFIVSVKKKMWYVILHKNQPKWWKNRKHKSIVKAVPPESRTKS